MKPKTGVHIGGDTNASAGRRIGKCRHPNHVIPLTHNIFSLRAAGKNPLAFHHETVPEKSGGNALARTAPQSGETDEATCSGTTADDSVSFVIGVELHKLNTVADTRHQTCCPPRVVGTHPHVANCHAWSVGCLYCQHTRKSRRNDVARGGRNAHQTQTLERSLQTDTQSGQHVRLCFRNAGICHNHLIKAFYFLSQKGS